MSHYFYFENNSQKGPITLEEMVKLITPETEVWTQGLANWTKAKDVPEVAAALGLAASDSEANPGGQSTTDTADTNTSEQVVTVSSTTTDSSTGNSAADSNHSAQPNQQKLKDDARLYSILSIISTLACCNIVGGLIAAVYAIVSEVYYNQGNYAEAEQKLKAAKIWFFVTLGVMVLGYIIYIVFYGAMFSAMSGALHNIK